MDASREELACGHLVPYDPTVRATFSDEKGDIYAWPSRGGVIILDNAQALDFEFVGLDPLDPPAHREHDQGAEDEFCQRLLLLGAKWWDSEERYFFVAGLEQIANGYTSARYGHRDGSFRNVSRPSPTMREKRCIRVGWHSAGGLWVSEFDTTWAGVDEEDNLPPDEGLARVNLARTMDERCAILKEKFRAKFYRTLNDYEGQGFLRAWEWKTTGEVDRNLLTPQETVEQWRESFNRRG